ncbi:hypothetical protein VHEMI05589 [[Torrubiella] hemipterigena]|uniref:Uncharacterized protein n=1 Tax=[Torrubiella] hemipterigena TaxID=1531966 RepID=A0A0A1T4N5_9HYPO|nr:hypothetical protein VHEMI05589 [[Torrubiella] hemipterigena]
MTDVETKIKQAAATNAELLTILANTEHAIPTAEEHDRLIADLQQQIAETEKKKKNVERKKNITQEQHEKYRDSRVKRFLYKATGKKERYQEKASAEEQKHFAMIQELRDTEDVLASLVSHLGGTVEVKPSLDAEAKKHKDAEIRLEDLYNSIFSGPTPSFPEEDVAEQRYIESSKAYRQAKMDEQKESTCATLLGEAKRQMSKAFQEIDRALQYSRADMFGGGMMMDMMERNHLSECQRWYSESQITVTRAQNASPMVGAMPQVYINTGNIMTDVFFDNIFTDMAFHKEIKRARGEMDRLWGALTHELAASISRRDALRGNATLAEQAVASAREILQVERSKIFDQVLRSTGDAKLIDLAGRGLHTDAKNADDRAGEDLPPYSG